MSSRWLDLDLCGLLAAAVITIGCLEDLLRYRLVCRNAAISGEHYIFTKIAFRAVLYRSIQPTIQQYLDILDSSPTLSNRARHLALYPSYYPDWLSCPQLASVASRLSGTGLMTTLTIERGVGRKAPLSLGTHILNIHPILSQITTLSLDDAGELPNTFFNTFTELEDLSIKGTSMSPPGVGTATPSHKPALRKFRYSYRGSYSFSRPDVVDDGILNCFEWSRLESLECRGTEHRRDVRVFTEAVRLAAGNLALVVVDVSGLFGAPSYAASAAAALSSSSTAVEPAHHGIQLDFPPLLSIERLYFQCCIPWHLSPAEDWSMGLCKVVDALLPTSNLLNLRIDVVFCPTSEPDDILLLRWSGLDQSLLRLSRRCTTLTLDLRLLLAPVQGTSLENNPWDIAAPGSPMKNFVPHCVRSDRVLIVSSLHKV
ncbi:hypothetical protein BKA70DRAFT_1447927 [Coprinopsis sp. MPI-PUGE-AT-0042]|nr:hypothetical protein BKA70DRAFT_1447927 [Coprinopsis sp. MPI-PUGE-AT-0042]